MFRVTSHIMIVMLPISGPTTVSLGHDFEDHTKSVAKSSSGGLWCLERWGYLNATESGI